MERVWVTRRGGRYHAERNCPALKDGHAKAASEGYPNHPPVLISLDQVGSGVSPCSRCWPTRSEWDEWKQLEHQTIRLGESTFEYEFLHRVLKHVKGLEPYYIRVQHEVTGSAGRNFRLDFALLPPGGRKIAIEIDGFDKTSAGSVATKEHQDKDSSRRNELHIAGWEVLSFTNRQVQTESGECRREIENLLLTRHSSSERGEASVPVLPQPSVPVLPQRTVPVLPQPSVPTGYSSPPTAEKLAKRSVPLGWLTAAAVAAIVVGVLWAGSDTETGAASPPNGSSCSADAPVKGNVSDSGERIYHLPGWRYYASTWPEECFESSADAEDAGYRASRVQ